MNVIRNIAIALAASLALMVLSIGGLVVYSMLRTAWDQSVAPWHGWFWFIAAILVIVVGGAGSSCYLFGASVRP